MLYISSKQDVGGLSKIKDTYFKMKFHIGTFI